MNWTLQISRCGQVLKCILWFITTCCKSENMFIFFSLYCQISDCYTRTNITLSHKKIILIIFIVLCNKLFTLLTAPNFLKINCCCFPRWCTIIRIQWAIRKHLNEKKRVCFYDPRLMMFPMSLLPASSVKDN